MAARLITTYVLNDRRMIDEPFYRNAIKLFIVRSMDAVPRGYIWIPDLAPSESFFKKYKYESLPWDKYVDEFRIDMLSRTKMVDMINLVKTRLTEGRDVIMCCFEKDYKKCHRFILSNYFAELGFECGEYLREDEEI